MLSLWKLIQTLMKSFVKVGIMLGIFGLLARMRANADIVEPRRPNVPTPVAPVPGPVIEPTLPAIPPSVDRTKPRSVRNNNPGNIRLGDNWQGSVAGSDREFVTFSAPIWGARAMLIILRTYYNRHGLKTINEIISRWAPASDGNHVANYANFVARRAGVRPSDKIDFDRMDVPRIAHAMAIFEAGGEFFSLALFVEAWDKFKIG